MRFSFTLVTLVTLVTLAGCAPEEDTRPEAQRSSLTSDDGGALPAVHVGGAGDAGDAGDASAPDDGGSATPGEGAPCDDASLPIACDVDTNGPVTPTTCWTGQRTCVTGAWSRCASYARRFH